MRRSSILCLLVVLFLAACSSSSGTKTGASSTASSPPTTTTTASATATATTSAASSSAQPKTSSAPALHDFTVADASWIGSNGWALGTADCLSGSGRCDAIEHTTDGGASWHSLPAPRTSVVLPNVNTASCKTECLDGLRFATTTIGYAFGRANLSRNQSHAFYLTTDGGRTWKQQAGNAEALETLHGAVLRVVTSTPGCPPGCAYRVERAAVGATAWHSIALPGSTQVDEAELGWAGHNVYLETLGNPAGGAGSAHSVLFTSSDDGLHWTRRGEPCPQFTREVDGSHLSVAPDGQAAVLCRSRIGGTDQLVAATSDGGAKFVVSPRPALGSAPVQALGVITSRSWIVSGDRTYRTTNGGDNYAVVGPGPLAWVAFGSSTTGHAISADRRTIWDTSDAGRAWHSYTFP